MVILMPGPLAGIVPEQDLQRLLLLLGLSQRDAVAVAAGLQLLLGRLQRRDLLA